MESKQLDEMVGERVATAKAHIVGSDVQASNVIQGIDEAERRFSLVGAIEPPYNPVTLAAMLEHSNALRQNIDAYGTNIDGFGHRFEPILDIDAEDIDQRIEQAVYLDRKMKLAEPGANPALATSLMPTPEEVAAKKREIVEAMRAEKTRLDHFFRFCTEEMSLVTLRRKLRQDLELIGNGYIEVLRNNAGEVAEFVYMPSFTVRLLALDADSIEVAVPARISDLSVGTVKKRKRLRRFVQIFEATAVFFKEFGDPRIMSRRTGAVFDTVEALKRLDQNDAPATEVLHFKIHSSRSAYGIPRWIGNLLSVLGSRQAEEVNYLYFENKSVPPLAILVSGGRLSADSVARLETYISSEIKGKKNFHKTLIIEAESTSSTTLQNPNQGRMRIDIQPLTDSQNKDALFQNYDERNIDKVGMSFRLPRMLRGDIRDFNRASAEAALDFAEQQVFGPEREEFDFIINRKILADLGVCFWEFRSNAPTIKDPKQLAEIIRDLVLANVLTPAEARELAGGVFNKELAVLDAAWTRQPVPLTLAGFDPESGRLHAWAGGEDVVGASPAPFGDRDANGTLDEQEKAAGPAPQITRTITGHVLSVNEIRSALKYGPKKLADGSLDPDGELDYVEYQEKRKAKHQAAAAASNNTLLSTAGIAGAGQTYKAGEEGELAPPLTSAMQNAGELSFAELQAPGGPQALAQGRRMRRIVPGRIAAKTASAMTLEETAKALIAIRSALRTAEEDAAVDEFAVSQDAVLAKAIEVVKTDDAHATE